METCANCGEQLAPAWKFCIHCGTPRPAVAEIADAAPVTPIVVDEPAPTRGSRPLIIAGILVFVVGIALLAVSIAVLTGLFH